MHKALFYNTNIPKMIPAKSGPFQGSPEKEYAQEEEYDALLVWTLKTNPDD